MSFRQPMRQRGVLTARWAPWRDQNRLIVFGLCRKRAGRALCMVENCTAEAAELHHLFARRQTVGEPLASHWTMTVAICKEHHRAFTNNRDLEAELPLMADAIDSAMHEFHVDLPDHRDATLADLPELLVGDARAIERAMKTSGEWQRLLDRALPDAA